MPQLKPEIRVVRFGSFEADLREGVLTKSGFRIKLQEQPFQILALLLAVPVSWSRETKYARSSGRKTLS